jgi:hypothetical protein
MANIMLDSQIDIRDSENAIKLMENTMTLNRGGWTYANQRYCLA